MYLWEIVNILLGEHFTALLHCNASNQMFEILKHSRVWGDNLH